MLYNSLGCVNYLLGFLNIVFSDNLKLIKKTILLKS